MYHHTPSANGRIMRMRSVCTNAILGHMQSIAFWEKACRRFSYRHKAHIYRSNAHHITMHTAYRIPHHWIHQMTMGNGGTGHSAQYAYVESISTRNNDLSCEQFNAMDHVGWWSKDNNALWHATMLRILFWIKSVSRNGIERFKICRKRLFGNLEHSFCRWFWECHSGKGKTLHENGQ